MRRAAAIPQDNAGGAAIARNVRRNALSLAARRARLAPEQRLPGQRPQSGFHPRQKLHTSAVYFYREVLAMSL